MATKRSAEVERMTGGVEIEQQSAGAADRLGVDVIRAVARQPVGDHQRQFLLGLGEAHHALGADDVPAGG